MWHRRIRKKSLMSASPSKLNLQYEFVSAKTNNNSIVLWVYTSTYKKWCYNEVPFNGTIGTHTFCLLKSSTRSLCTSKFHAVDLSITCDPKAGTKSLQKTLKKLPKILWYVYLNLSQSYSSGLHWLNNHTHSLCLFVRLFNPLVHRYPLISPRLSCRVEEWINVFYELHWFLLMSLTQYVMESYPSMQS